MMTNTRLPSNPAPNKADDINSRTSDSESALSQEPLPMIIFISSFKILPPQAQGRGQGDKGTRGQGDKETRRQGDLNSFLLVSPYPCLLVSLSPCPLVLAAVAPKPHRKRKILRPRGPRRR